MVRNLRERGRETDRQTYKQTDRETERERDTERERERESERRVGFKNNKVCLYQRSIESKVKLKELG